MPSMRGGCAGARTHVWFEYVMSDANPADEPSRVLSLAGSLYYPAAGVVSSPVPLVCPMLAPLSNPEGWVRLGLA